MSFKKFKDFNEFETFVKNRMKLMFQIMKTVRWKDVSLLLFCMVMAFCCGAMFAYTHSAFVCNEIANKCVFWDPSDPELSKFSGIGNNKQIPILPESNIHPSSQVFVPIFPNNITNNDSH